MINLKDGHSSNGVTFTDPHIEIDHVINFQEKEFNNLVPPVIMFGNCGEVTVKIDFHEEYKNDKFNITRDNLKFVGFFEENEKFSNPIILEQV